MLIDSQLTEIRNYLLTKKLPIDILIEVQDHFISQISSIQQEENLDFEMAFARVKESWQNELKMRKWDNGKEVSQISYKVDGRKSTRIMFIALIVTILFCLSTFLIINFIDFNTFQNAFAILIVCSVLIPLMVFILNFNDFLLMKKFKPLKLNIHQNNIFILIIGLGFIFLNFSKFYDIKFYNHARLGNDDFRFYLWIFFFLGYFLYFAGLFSQIQFLKVLKKTKPFLKNFQNYAK